MMERIKTGIEHLADFYRTAAFGETGFIFSACSVSWTYDNPLALIFLSLPGMANGIFLTREQFRLRKRLEESVQIFGYDSRAFSKTLDEWCDRQTAYVVAKNYGYLEQFLNLCELHRRSL